MNKLFLFNLSRQNASRIVTAVLLLGLVGFGIRANLISQPKADEVLNSDDMYVPYSSYTLKVESFKGVPLPGIFVSLSPVQETAAAGPIDTDSATTTDNGEAVFEALDAGRYKVSLYTPDEEALTISDVGHRITLKAGDPYTETLTVNYPPNVAPEFRYLSPASNQEIRAGTPFSFNYFLKDDDDPITVSFYVDTNNSDFDGTAITECTDLPAGSRTCTLSAGTTTNLLPGAYYIYALASDGFDHLIATYTTWTLTIQNQNASFSFLAPSSTPSSPIVQGTAFAIRYNLKDSYTNTKVNFGYRYSGSGTAITPITNCQNQGLGDNKSCIWDTSSSKPGYYQVTATVLRNGATTGVGTNAPSLVKILPRTPNFSNLTNKRKDLQLQWSNTTILPSNDRSEFQIFRSETATFTDQPYQTVIGTTAGQTLFTWVDTNVKSKKIYYYKVRQQIRITGANGQETLYSDFSAVKSLKAK